MSQTILVKSTCVHTSVQGALAQVSVVVDPPVMGTFPVCLDVSKLTQKQLSFFDDVPSEDAIDYETYSGAGLVAVTLSDGNRDFSVNDANKTHTRKSAAEIREAALEPHVYLVIDETSYHEVQGRKPGADGKIPSWYRMSLPGERNENFLIAKSDLLSKDQSDRRLARQPMTEPYKMIPKLVVDLGPASRPLTVSYQDENGRYKREALTAAVLKCNYQQGYVNKWDKALEEAAKQQEAQILASASEMAEQMNNPSDELPRTKAAVQAMQQEAVKPVPTGSKSYEEFVTQQLELLSSSQGFEM